MSNKYKAASKANKPGRRDHLTNSERLEILGNTQNWQVVGSCQRLPPLDPEERRKLIQSKGRRRF